MEILHLSFSGCAGCEKAEWEEKLCKEEDTKYINTCFSIRKHIEISLDRLFLSC